MFIASAPGFSFILDEFHFLIYKECSYLSRTISLYSFRRSLGSDRDSILDKGKEVKKSVSLDTEVIE
jgi:hypothetical protein